MGVGSMKGDGGGVFEDGPIGPWARQGHI